MICIFPMGKLTLKSCLGPLLTQKPYDWGRQFKTTLRGLKKQGAGRSGCHAILRDLAVIMPVIILDKSFREVTLALILTPGKAEGRP